MKDSMNKLKRMIAFLLCMLLLTTTVGDDFFALAEDDIQVEESASESEPAAAEPAEAAPAEEASVAEEPAVEPQTGESGEAAEATAEPDAIAEGESSGETPSDETPVDPAAVIAENAAEIINNGETVPGTEETVNSNEQNPENQENGDSENPSEEGENQNENSENPEETPSENIDENNESGNTDDGNGEKTEETIADEETGDEVDKDDKNKEELEDDENIDDEEEIDEEDAEKDDEEENLEEEEETEEEECEHEWKYTSNGDGTHVKRCALCGEEYTEGCTFDAEGTCTCCGYKKDEEECQHEWEYESNNDGTHIKRCTLCGEEETEECTFNEDGICIYCGYEKDDEEYELVETYFSKTIDGVVVSVYGWIPAGAYIEISSVSISTAEAVVENAGKEDFEVFKAFDIQIYMSSGDIYQPETDGRSVEITVKGVSEVGEVADYEVEVLREEHDGSVEELNPTVNGEDVTFNSEHFSLIILGVTNSTSQGTITVIAGNSIGTAEEAATYVRVNSAYITVEMEEDQELSIKATVYKNNTTVGRIASGEVVGTAKSTNYTASADETHTFNFTFDSTSETWISPGTNYSVVFTVSDGTAEIEYGFNDSPIYLSGDTDAQSEKGAVIVTAEESDAPSDITAIMLKNSNSDRTLYSATGSAAAYTGSICYLVGDTDTLTVQLSPSYTRAITWTLTSNSGAPGAIVRSSSDTTTGMAYNLTAEGAGIMTLEAKYSNSIVATLSITVLQPYFEGNTAQTSYSVEYKGSAYEPTIGLYNGSNSVTIDSTSYTDNTDAGTATATVTYTNNVTYNFKVPFTITQKALSWSTNFSNISWTGVVNTSTDKVIADPGATSTLSVSLVWETDYTVTLSNKAYTTSGITYTATIGEGTSGNYSASGVSGTITVSTASTDINNYVEVHWANDSVPRYKYTGSGIEPIADMTWGTDFIFYLKDTTTVATFVTSSSTTVEYDNNTNVGVGTAVVKFTVTGYSGYLTLKFTIYALDISDKLTITIANEDGTEVTSGIAKYTHTGSAITPDDYLGDGTKDYITVAYGSTSLTKNTDYTVSYTNNKNIGTATVTISGMGNYSGSQDAYFTIKASFALDATIYVSSSTYGANADNDWASGYSRNYTGEAVKPSVYVELNGQDFTGYTVDYADTINSDNTKATAITADAGTKYVICTYNGVSIAASYTVKKIDISTNSAAVFTVINSEQTYTGKAIGTTLTAGTDYSFKYTSTEKENTLTKDTDYTLAFADDTNVGTATITITGTGSNYTGTQTATFTITPASITACTINLEYTEHAYTGSYLTPTVNVVFNNIDMGTTTTSVTNFSVSYADNKAIGTASVTITGTNNLTGSTVLTFTITSKSLNNLTVTINGKSVQTDAYNHEFFVDDSLVYIGKEVTCKVVIKDGSTTLEKGADGDYTVSLTNGKSIADPSKYAYNDTNVTYTSAVVITGQNNYNGTTRTIYFNISPRSIEADTVTKTITNPSWSSTTPFVPTVELVDNGTDLKSTLRGQPLTEYSYTVTAETATTAGASYAVTIEGKGNYTGTYEDTFSVGKDISTATVTLVNPFYASKEYSKNSNDVFVAEYLGQSTHPTATVVVDGTTLTRADSDDDADDSGDTTGDYTAYYYSEQFSGDTYNAHNGSNVITVELTGINGYYGTYTYYYKIEAIDLSKPTTASEYVSKVDPAGIPLPANGYDLGYTGSTIDIAPSYDSSGANTNDNAFTLTYYGYYSTSTQTAVETLTYGDDYVLNPTAVGAPVKDGYDVTITGQGNYSGTRTYTYNVVAGELGTISIDATKVDEFLHYDDDTQTYWVYYTGSEIKIDNYLIVTNAAGDTLTKGTDYTLNYSNNTNPSTSTTTATVTATGTGNYSTTSTTAAVSFTIKAISVDDFVVTFDKVYTYSGSAYKPKASDITVTYGTGGEVLTAGTDFEILTDGYGTNTLPGLSDDSDSTYDNYITISGLGHYTGTKRATFSILLNLEDYTNGTTTTDNSKKLITISVGGPYTIDAAIPKSSITVSYFDTVQDSYVAVDSSYYNVTGNTSVPGDGTLLFTGLNYVANSCTVAAKFVIDLSTDAGKAYFTMPTNIAYTGSEIDIAGKLTCLLDTAILGTDYTVSYPTFPTAEELVEYKTKVGQKTITVTATDDSNYFINSCTFKPSIKYDLDKLVVGTTLTITSPDAANPISYDSTNEYYYATYSKLIGTSGLPYTVTAQFGPDTTTDVLSSDTPNGDTYLKVTDNGLTSVGSKLITVSIGNSDYVMGGPRTIPVEIEGINIDDYYGEIMNEEGTAYVTYDEYQYTGKEIQPEVRVRATSSTAESEALVLGSDYTVSYHAAAQVSTTELAYAIITGNEAAGYIGTLKIPYKIVARDISTCDIDVETAYYVGSSVPVMPKVTITYGSTEFTEGTDYTVTYTNNTMGATDYTGVKGKYSVTALGGNVTGSIAATDFDIKRLDFSNTDMVYLVDEDGDTIDESKELVIDYTRDTQDEYELVTAWVNNPYYQSDDDKTYALDPSSAGAADYTITVYNAANVVSEIKEMGTYTLKVSGNTNRNCEETRIVRVRVAPRSIPANYINNTGEINITVSDVETLNTDPTIAITDSGVYGATTTDPVPLVNNTDYTYTVTGNDVAAAGAYKTDSQGNYVTDDYGNYVVADGSPYVTITGMTNYSTDPVNIAFSVGKDLGVMKENGEITYTKENPASYICEYYYDGVSHIPTLDITLVSDGTALVEGTDYTVEVTEDGVVDSISAGEKTITVTGMGKYYGSFTDTYKINKRVISGSITWNNKYTYQEGVATTDKLTFTMAYDDMKVLTATEALAIFNDASLAGYYYVEYDGEAIKPTLSITDPGLAEGADTTIAASDYAYTYVHNDAYYDPAVYGDWTCVQINFTDDGNYSGASPIITAYFLIGPNDIEKNDFKVQFADEEELKLRGYVIDYTGYYQTPEVVVSDNSSSPLTEGKDYKVYYSDKLLTDTSTSGLKAATTPRDPGIAYVYVEGINSYTGVKYREFYISEDISNDLVRVGTFDDSGTFTEGIPNLFQTGKAVIPDFSVILDRKEYTSSEKAYKVLTKGTNYTVSIGDTDDYETYEDIVITANSTTTEFYTNSKTVRVGIVLDHSLVEISGYEDEYEYIGVAINPDFETNYDNISVTNVAYKNSSGTSIDASTVIDVGTYTADVTWTAESGETDTIEVEFAIVQRSLSDCTVVIGKSQRYTGKSLKPSFTVFLKTTDLDDNAVVTKLKSGTDYTTTYDSSTTGTGVITLTGKGNFKDYAFPTYDINLWPVVNLRVTATTQSSISIAWERDMYSDGTELTLQKMNSSGQYVAVGSPIKVAGKTTKYTFTGLESSSKYQIKARAYTDSGVYTANEKAAYVQAATELSSSSVTGSSPASGKAMLTWLDSGDVTMYYIYRDTNTTSKSDDTLVAVIPASTGEYTNVNLAAGTYYYYLKGYYLSNGTKVEVNESDYVEIVVN